VGLDLQIPEDRIKASKAICDIIAESASGVEREVFIGKASEILSLPADVLKNNVDLIIKKRVREHKQNESKQAQLSIKHIGDRVNPDAIRNVQATSLEESILGLLLIYDEYRQGILNGKIELCEDDFVTAFGKRVFTSIIEVASGGGEFLYSMLGQYLSAEEMGRLEMMRQNRLSLTENGMDVLRASIDALRAERDKKRSSDEGDKFAVLRAKQEKLKNKRNSNTEG
jgi:hypothetical protein